MAASVNTRRSTGAIVTALVAALKALQWPTAPGGPVAAFDDVRLFDSEDLVSAFKFLVIAAQRVAVVVPLPEDFPQTLGGPEGRGLKMAWTRRLPVMVLCSDATLGDRSASLWGATAAVNGKDSPGAMGLAELVLPALTGQLLANQGPVPGPALSGVLCAPKSASVLLVKDTESALPSRVTVGVEFECVGGRLEAVLQKGLVY